MDEESKKIITYVLQELSQVMVAGQPNIKHMDIAMDGLISLLNRPKDEPKEEKEGKK